MAQPARKAAAARPDPAPDTTPATGAPAQAPRPPRDGNTADVSAATPRLSIPLTDDRGAVRWESVRPTTKEKLRELLRDPRAVAELGADSAAGAAAAAAAGAAPAVDEFPREMVGIVYDAVGSLLIAWARRSGYTADQAAILAFTPDEKSALAEPTGKVIDKWLPATLGKYQEESMLAIALVSVVYAKVSLLQRATPAPVLAGNFPRATADPNLN